MVKSLLADVLWLVPNNHIGSAGSRRDHPFWPFAPEGHIHKFEPHHHQVVGANEFNGGICDLQNRRILLDGRNADLVARTAPHQVTYGSVVAIITVVAITEVVTVAVGTAGISSASGGRCNTISGGTDGRFRIPVQI